MWYRFLRKYPIQFRRQVSFGCYIVDFYCWKGNLAVELDGSQHYEPQVQVYDQRRSAYLEEELGMQVLRFTNEEVLREFDAVCARIDAAVRERIPSSVSLRSTASPRGSYTTKENHMKQVTIYTDGACSGNPGPGGWGAILMYGEHKKELSGGEDSTTNNRMELTAVIEALRCLNQPCAVDLWSDSKYVIDGLEKGWAKGWQARGWVKSDKKPALNPDLWEELLRLVDLHTLRCHWVKGHAENPYNNRCDEMAVSEWKKRK